MVKQPYDLDVFFFKNGRLSQKINNLRSGKFALSHTIIGGGQFSFNELWTSGNCKLDF